MIAGQSPRLVWRDNPGGEVRTLAEAIEVARRNGVTIPEDVHFSIDTIGDLGPEVTARGPQVRLVDGELASWADLVNKRNGKIPFRLWAGLFKSDEAILAVLAHEMFELELARPYLVAGDVPIGAFIERTCPGVPGNWHDRAWDVADRLVERMRQEGES